MNTNLLKQLKTPLAGVYTPAEYPALNYQLRMWSDARPLQGVQILDAAPVFRNTLVKYLPLVAAGAELSVGISDVMPCDQEVVRFLTDAGVPIVDARNGIPWEYDLVLDCAGAFAAASARIGYVELTRSGVGHYKQCPKPVYIADSGRIKRIETMLGTGESYFRAMRRRGYADWQGRRIVVFGSGKVGSGILFYALREGASVTVVTEPETLDAAFSGRVEVVAWNDRRAVIHAVEQAYAVVTATGVAGAVTLSGAAQTAVESNALLANMGVEDEYGFEVPTQRVLGGKRPLNFELEEPTHLKYIDATLALHNAGAYYLLAHPEATGLLLPDAATEEVLLRVSCENGIAGGEITDIL